MVLSLFEAGLVLVLEERRWYGLIAAVHRLFPQQIAFLRVCVYQLTIF